MEAYWNEAAPRGVLPFKEFTFADGIELLLCDLRRYQAAIARVFEKEQEHRHTNAEVGAWKLPIYGCEFGGPAAG